MLHAGLDLSRRKLDVCLLSESGEQLDQLAAPADADALRTLAERIDELYGEPLRRCRVDHRRPARPRHARAGGLARRERRRAEDEGPGAAGLQDRQDRLAGAGQLGQRDLVPAIWLPDPQIREERELARFRLRLVKHKSALKNRVHSTPINFGEPVRSPTCSESRGERCLPDSRRAASHCSRVPVGWVVRSAPSRTNAMAPATISGTLI
jgi:transposase